MELQIKNELKKMQQIMRNKRMQPIFFIGSGLSKRYLGSPDWKSLLKEVANKTDCNYEELNQLCNGENEKIAQELEFYSFRKADDDAIKDRNHRRALRNIIAKIFMKYVTQFQKTNIQEENEKLNREICEQLNMSSKQEESDSLSWFQMYSKEYRSISEKLEKCSENVKKIDEIIEFGKIMPKAIITTNYDKLIEDIIFENKCNIHIGQEGFTNTSTEDAKIDLYKIHGCVSEPDSIIITKEDYDNFFCKSKYLYSKILTMFCEYPIIFIGYSISDRNIKDILTVMIEIMSQEQKKELLERMWIVDFVKHEEQEKVVNKEIELLNGNAIQVTCLYLTHYGKLYKAINKIALKPEFKNLKFTIADQVIDLLIEPLYEQQDKLKVVTRELLQNALDACKKKRVDADIKIRILEEEQNRYLEVRDNGIGMSLQDIRENFLTVGKTNKKNNCDGLVGKYGVGILSIFLIGESAEVYTKKEGCQELALKIYIKDDKKQVEWLTADRYGDNSDNTSFTAVKICLNSWVVERGKLDESVKQCIESLGLDTYFTKMENTILVECKMGKQQIPKMNKPKWFMDLSEGIQLYKSKWLEADDGADEEQLKKIVDRDGYVFYNDMTSSVTYETLGYKQLINQRVPFVIIDKKNAEEAESDIKTNLSRSNIHISGNVMRLIARGIYENEIKHFAKKLSSIKDKAEDASLHEVLSSIKEDCSVIGKNTDMLVYQHKLYFSKIWQWNHLEIYGSITSYEQMINAFDRPILFRNGGINKARISDILSYNQVVAISTKYLDDYIYYASGPQNGLKKKALIVVLNHLGIMEISETDLSTSIWQYIDKHKETIKKKYDSLSSHGIIWFQDSYKKDELKGDGQYIIISESMYVDNYLDPDFYEILKDHITKNSLNEYIGIHE